MFCTTCFGWPKECTCGVLQPKSQACQCQGHTNRASDQSAPSSNNKKDTTWKGVRDIRSAGGVLIRR